MKKLGFICIAGIVGSMLFPVRALAAVHAAGVNVISNGTVYMITDDGHKRPYTSGGAFLSYGFNSWQTLQQASAEDLALPDGAFIPPRDGKIVCSDRGADKGTCYLITNGKRAAFVSESVFKSLGFSFGKALTGDVSFMEKDADISDANQTHKSGVLINKNGTIYLVSSSGLLGIPSMDVLASWGYSAEDAVTANTADGSLIQSSVVAGRQGAKLSPNEGAAPIVQEAPSEEALMQSYIDTYPDLPTITISAPQDGAAVISLVKKIQELPNGKIATIAPYVSSLSLEMLQSSPKMTASFEAPGTHAAGMVPVSSNIQVFEGGMALYTDVEKQSGTNYTDTYYWVCKKENGAWKWDLIGTWKYEAKIETQKNPGNSSTLGSGSSDIAIADAGYADNPAINDPNTWLYVMVKNNGQTTIEKFHLLVRINNLVARDRTMSYELTPGTSLVLAVPLDEYWAQDSAIKSAGQLTTTVSVNLDYQTNESITADNTKTFSVYFNSQPAVSVMTKPVN